MDGAEGAGGGEGIRRRGRPRCRRIRPELRDVFVGDLREGFEDEAAEQTRAPRADGRVNGGDAVEMDQLAVGCVGFEDFEIGMIEDKPAFFQRTAPTVDDEVLSGLEDFREVAEVEPAALHGGGGDASGFFGQHEGELAAAAEVGGPDRVHGAAQAEVVR